MNQRVSCHFISVSGGKEASYSSHFFYTDPSHYPNHAGSGWFNAQIWLKKPVDGILVRGLPERFLGKMGMENAESKKELEIESQTRSKASLQERPPLCHSKNNSMLMTPKGLHPGGKGTREVLEALPSCPVAKYLTCMWI